MRRFVSPSGLNFLFRMAVKVLPRFKPLSFLLLIFYAFALAGCGPISNLSPYDIDGEFKNKLKRSQKISAIVQKYQKRANQKPTTSTAVDYAIVKAKAIEILETSLTSVSTPIKIKEIALGELSLLDPDNKLLFQAKLTSERSRNIYELILEETAAMVPSVAKFNVLLLESIRLKNNRNSIYNKKAMNRNIGEGVWNLKRLKKLLHTKVKNVPGCDSNEENAIVLSCISKIMEFNKVQFFVHPSAIRYINQKRIKLDPKIKNFAHLIVWLSKTEKISSLFFYDGVYLFRTARVPRDLSNQRSSFLFNARYIPVAGLANSVISSGYADAVKSVDAKANHMWVSATPADFLEISEIVNSVDSAKPQVKIDLDFVEVQDRFLQEIGLRIPQVVNTAFSDPVYRYYNFPNIEFPNNGLVTQPGVGGGFSLNNLDSSSTLSSIIRLLIQDGGFGATAREIKSHLAIRERPSIVMRSGSNGVIDVGLRHPTFTSQVSPSGTVSENVLMIDTGVRASLTATVADYENVSIKMDLSISNFIEHTTSARGSRVPATSKRNVISEFSVKDRETIILGGIVSEREYDRNNGIPILSSLGWTSILGGEKRRSKDKTSILIMLTPKIANVNINSFSRGFVAPDGNSRGRDSNNILNSKINKYLLDDSSNIRSRR